MLLAAFCVSVRLLFAAARLSHSPRCAVFSAMAGRLRAVCRSPCFLRATGVRFRLLTVRASRGFEPAVAEVKRQNSEFADILAANKQLTALDGGCAFVFVLVSVLRAGLAWGCGAEFGQQGLVFLERVPSLVACVAPANLLSAVIQCFRCSFVAIASCSLLPGLNRVVLPALMTLIAIRFLQPSVSVSQCLRCLCVQCLLIRAAVFVFCVVDCASQWPTTTVSVRETCLRACRATGT